MAGKTQYLLWEAPRLNKAPNTVLGEKLEMSLTSGDSCRFCCHAWRAPCMLPFNLPFALKNVVPHCRDAHAGYRTPCSSYWLLTVPVHFRPPFSRPLCAVDTTSAHWGLIFPFCGLGWRGSSSPQLAFLFLQSSAGFVRIPISVCFAITMGEGGPVTCSQGWGMCTYLSPSP